MYVYLNSEPGLFTVGFYKPSGEWVAESDHCSSGDAAMRVHYLNGGQEKSILELAKEKGVKIAKVPYPNEADVLLTRRPECDCACHSQKPDPVFCTGCREEHTWAAAQEREDA